LKDSKTLSLDKEQYNISLTLGRLLMKVGWSSFLMSFSWVLFIEIIDNLEKVSIPVMRIRDDFNPDPADFQNYTELSPNAPLPRLKVVHGNGQNIVEAP
jgi:hypothetical protein